METANILFILSGGGRFSRILDLVLPSERTKFESFLCGSCEYENLGKKDQYENFHFMRNTDEYRLNRVLFDHEVLNGKYVRCVMRMSFQTLNLFFPRKPEKMLL